MDTSAHLPTLPFASGLPSQLQRALCTKSCRPPRVDLAAYTLNEQESIEGQRKYWDPDVARSIGEMIEAWERSSVWVISAMRPRSSRRGAIDMISRPSSDFQVG